MDFPQGTNELYELLGAHGHGHDDVTHANEPANEPQNHNHGFAFPVDLAADALHPPKEKKNHVDESANVADAETEHIDGNVADNPAPVHTGELGIEELERQAFAHKRGTESQAVQADMGRVKRIAKNIWPYALVFAVSLFVFLLLFTNVSIKNWFSSGAPKNQQITTNYPNMAAYNSWIQSYFYEVSDSKMLDPNTDLSGDGLTNYQKFVLGLNPKRVDTAGLGMSDSQALINGINPLTGGPVTDQQKKIIAQYVDLEALSNKLTLAAANTRAAVAGASVEYNDLSGNAVTIDQNRNGQLDIPSLNISVPIVWTQDVKNFDTDLKNGVVHYPGTALPGQVGVSYISGHSSNYAWAGGSYNKIFATLGDLKQYDSFTITAYDTTGNKVIFHYIVTASKTFAANDQSQFTSQGKPQVALSTCWPVGTVSKRLVVFADLSQVDK
ncbi:sortase [Patescibacteria group bacterium]|nr:sortase [Patescibacteria group bacterium]